MLHIEICNPPLGFGHSPGHFLGHSLWTIPLDIFHPGHSPGHFPGHSLWTIPPGHFPSWTFPWTFSGTFPLDNPPGHFPAHFLWTIIWDIFDPGHLPGIFPSCPRHLSTHRQFPQTFSPPTWCLHQLTVAADGLIVEV